MPEGSVGGSDFSKLSLDQLEEMLEAGREVIECHRVLAKTGDNIVGELLRDVDNFFEWNHYPEGDVYDNTSHSQYYYHAHPPDERPGEHGHFHTFLRPKGMPKGIRAARVSDYKKPKDPADALSHLVAISMDDKGFPISMFTVNRWVTADYWYKAEDVIKFIDLFEIDLAHPSWPVNRWLTGMMRLFRPQIVELLLARDRTIEDWRKKHPKRNPYKDHDIEVLSEAEVSIDDQMAQITSALEKHG
ncbi:MAG: hypothetical protein QNJ94_10785 [Alphaproteobacteria bacterium]|nr:hypothetical protein [Alphaproteobacteria bacterium]